PLGSGPEVAGFAAMRRTLLLAGVVLLVLWAPAAAAAQVGAGEEIDAYRVVIDIAPDGTVRFTETITYDFGSVARHGIYRDVVVRQGFDGDHDRIYPFELISVSSPTAPDDVVE